MENTPHLPLEIVSHILSFLDPVQQKHNRTLCKTHKHTYHVTYPTLIHVYLNQTHRLDCTDIYHELVLSIDLYAYIFELLRNHDTVISMETESLLISLRRGDILVRGIDNAAMILYSVFDFMAPTTLRLRSGIYSRCTCTKKQLLEGASWGEIPIMMDSIADDQFGDINGTIRLLLEVGDGCIVFE